MSRLLLVALLFCLSVSAQAVEVGGAAVDDSVHLGSSNLVLNGAGVRSKFILDLYVAALYLDRKKSSVSAVLADPGEKRIAIYLLRNINVEDLLYGFKTAIEKNHTAEELRLIEHQRSEFENIFHKMGKLKKGDVILMDYQRGIGTEISVNGGERGSIPGAAFYTALLKIWLGEKPAQDDLKQQLLGGE
jgi:hypothetical protein